MSLSKYAKHVLEFEAGDSLPQTVGYDNFRILQEKFIEISKKLDEQYDVSTAYDYKDNDYRRISLDPVSPWHLFTLGTYNETWVSGLDLLSILSQL
jgi:hypothetical protein